MLCPNCYQRGNHLGESEIVFERAEREHWQRMEQTVHARIEARVRIYSCQDMTQEELRALVPSL